MKIIECEQQTPEWYAARLGIPTASRFDKIVTPKKLELSKSADIFICELIAENLLGLYEDSDRSDWMTRGRQFEHVAADEYSFTYDVDLKKVGFITTDDGLIGCSPDRLIVGKKAGLEIKCPNAEKHIYYLLYPDQFVDAFRCQIQGSLWITEFEYWDLMSYHPNLPSLIKRCEPDDVFKIAMSAAMYGDTGFLARYEQAKKQIKIIVEDLNVRQKLAESA